MLGLLRTQLMNSSARKATAAVGEWHGLRPVPITRTHAAHRPLGRVGKMGLKQTIEMGEVGKANLKRNIGDPPIAISRNEQGEGAV